MADLSEQTDAADSITVSTGGVIEVREKTAILREGALDASFPPRYHRYTLAPGADLTGKDARIIAVAKAVWTADVVAAWRALQAPAE